MADDPDKRPSLATAERIIKPKKGLISIDFAELWRYRELFVFLAWRDVLVRYKQTFLGIVWAVLQPLATVAIFTFIFGYVNKNAENNGMTVFQYAVMCMAGMLPWQFFSNAMRESSNALVANAQMISKIYFPRLIVPSSAVLSGTVDFLIGCVLMAIMMMIAGTTLRPHLAMLPLFFLVGFLAAFAIGLWLSALNVKYRDVKYVVPFLAQMGLLVSPVGFPASSIPEKYLFWYNLNPMVGVIDGFRWSIFGDQFEPYWPGFTVSLTMTALLLVTGALFFRNSEKTFADVI
jgi:lipopolysaccharide transport system permease protein